MTVGEIWTTMSLKPGELQVGFLPEWLVYEFAYSYVQILDTYLASYEQGERGADCLARVARSFAETTRTTAFPAIKKYRERGF